MLGEQTPRLFSGMGQGGGSDIGVEATQKALLQVDVQMGLDFRPDLVATGNIGCITQLAAGCCVPVVHTVELLDWATGGPEPKAVAAG